MIGLIILAGIILLILGAVAIGTSFLPLQEKTEVKEVEEWDRWKEQKITKQVTVEASPAILLAIAGWKKGVVMLLISFGLFFISNTLMYGEAGYQYLIIKPGGSKSAIMDEGYHYVGPFVKVQEWQKYIDVKASYGEISEEVEGAMKPIPIRFVDQVTADMSLTSKFELPKDPEKFIKMAVKFRTMENLVHQTLLPTVREQAIQTGYMFSAQDYISGDAQSFRQAFDEQLTDGTYKVRKNEYRDTTYTSDITDTKVKRKIKDIAVRYVVEKITKNGVPIRIPHEITENGIIVTSVIVDQVKMDPGYQARLNKQKDESAKRQMQQQKIETAKMEQQRIRAEGERDKEAERSKQEKAAVSILIAKETKVQEEKSNKELALIALETEKINAEKKRVKADAEAYEIKKKVIAGITPEVKLKMQLDAEVAKAEALSKLKLPTTYIGGGSGSKSGDPMQLLILDAIKNKK